MKNTGIIFDFNGTLLWDTELHNEAWDLFLENHRIKLNDEEKNQRIHGRLNREIFKDLFEGKLSEDEIKAYSLEKEYMYQEILKKKGLGLADGVVELFERLKEAGIPFVIATASGIENVKFYMQELKLNRWFEDSHVIYNDGSVRGKPFPDLFLKAMKVLSMTGNQVIIFEDSIVGIQAAEAAGAKRVIIVNSTDGDYQDFEGVHCMVKGFNEVKWDWIRSN